jgi:hypothetical protein
MTRRFLGAGLLLTAAFLAAGCCGHKWCGKSSTASAPPCCPPPAPPCCPPGGSTIAPPPVTSGFAPPVVSIPSH